MRALAAALLVGLGCSAAPKGDRAEDYLPFSVPWTGTFACAGKEPQLLVLKHAAPTGKVWLIDVSRFYGGGQVGLLITSEERGILLHAVIAGQVHKVDPPQLFMPRSLAQGGGWSSSGSDAKLAGGGDLEPVGRWRARRLQLQFKAGGKDLAFALWLAPGTGIVRFQGGAGDLQGDWELTEAREEKK